MNICQNSVSIAKNCKIIYHFQKDFPEDGHDSKLVGKLYIFVNYMTLYPFFPVHYTIKRYNNKIMTYYYLVGTRTFPIRSVLFSFVPQSDPTAVEHLTGGSPGEVV